MRTRSSDFAIVSLVQSVRIRLILFLCEPSRVSAALLKEHPIRPTDFYNTHRGSGNFVVNSRTVIAPSRGGNDEVRW